MILAMALHAVPQASPIQSRPRTVETIVYTVRRGDTLDRLSRSFLVEAHTWRSLLKLAGIRDPRRLPAGRRLVIPRDWLRYTVEPARLASYRGRVTVAIGGRPLSPVVGMSVVEGAQLATGANSFVTLILADRSQVVLPSQTRVRVRQLRRILLTGAVDYRLEVESGRLETKVTPLGDPSGRYRIETPVSMTAVRGTDFRVAFTPGTATAATEVLGGTVALSGTADRQPPLLLEPGLGATIDDMGATRTEKLLPAPELDNPGQLQTRDSAEFHVGAVPGAARYRAVVASDAGFIQNLAEQISADGSFAIADIPDGNQFVRVSAIAPSGLEGLAQAYSFTRRLASLRASVEAGDDGYRFRWTGAGSGARRYRFQLMRDAAEARPIVDQVGLQEDAVTLRNLAPGIYYWRVGLLQIDSSGSVETWTGPEKLTIADTSANRTGR